MTAPRVAELAPDAIAIVAAIVHRDLASARALIDEHPDPVALAITLAAIAGGMVSMSAAFIDQTPAELMAAVALEAAVQTGER